MGFAAVVVLCKRMMRPVLGGLTVTSLLALSAPLWAENPDWWRHSTPMMRVIVLRHGVRAPTRTPSELADTAAHPWPNWPVAEGQLTAHGAQGMVSLGQRYRQSLIHSGWANRCDVPIVTISDSTVRDQVSAQAFLHGLLPHCRTSFEVRLGAQENPLFGNGKSQGKQSIVPGADQPNALALALLQRVLLGCDGQACWQAARQAHRRLLWCDSPQPGALKLAGTLSENLMLEYAQGMALPHVGWGRVDGETINRLIVLHNQSMQVFHQQMPFAAKAGSNLLAHILATLEQAVGRTPDVAPLAPRTTQAIYVFGHDTNLANLAGLLDLSWQSEHQADRFPPGGALIFELFEHEHQAWLRIRSEIPTLAALRAADLHHREAVISQTLRLPFCGQRRLCPLQQVQQFLQARLDPRNIRSTLPEMQLTTSPILPQPRHR